MKTFVAYVALLASVSSLALFASGQTTTGATGSDKDKQVEQEVRRLPGEEVEAFMHRDPKAMERLWSDDFVVTNPLNRFVTKQQVLGMVQSGFLIITSLERQIEYAKVYGDNRDRSRQ